MPNEYFTTQLDMKQAIYAIILSLHLSLTLPDTDRTVADIAPFRTETKPNQPIHWRRTKNDSIVRRDLFPTRMHGPHGGHDDRM